LKSTVRSLANRDEKEPARASFASRKLGDVDNADKATEKNSE
jgi:hypothetical protein